MEIKEGYKRTEVGVIPDDWDVGFIKSYATISTGGKNTQDHVADGAFPFFVRSQTVERINSYCYDGEAILTAGDGVGTGKVFHYITGKFDAHQRVYQISNFSSKLNGYYFFLYFSTNFYSRIMQMTAKSSVDSVRMEMIADMCIPIPPTLEEQEAIAGALSDVDGLILSLETLITKKRNIKQGVMQELLRPKEEWVRKKLGELLTIRHGKRQHDIVDENGDYPILATGGQIGKSNKFLYDKPSVLIGRKGTIDKPQYIEQPFWTVDTLFFSEIQKPNNAKYMFYQFCLIDWRQYNEASGVPSLNASTIENIEINIPDAAKQPDEQTRIANILSDIDTEISGLEEKLTKARQIKQGMVTELLTGKIRLVAPQLFEDTTVALEAVSQNWAFKEAVIIATLADQFGSTQFPLGRKRCTKLTYLMHRKAKLNTDGYLKKAAGPYNPNVRYSGPETLAQTKKYVCSHKSGKFSGFVSSDNIDEAISYFSKWYGQDMSDWLNQFRYKKNDDLEVLATVDMAMVAVCKSGEAPTLETVKHYIANEPEWAAKLEREAFCDSSIRNAIQACTDLFGDIASTKA
ncbi:MAG: restriction endonuclease subunit S [Thiotrichaceae bacterium]